MNSQHRTVSANLSNYIGLCQPILSHDLFFVDNSAILLFATHRLYNSYSAVPVCQTNNSVIVLVV